jgi:hypothetical protein
VCLGLVDVQTFQQPTELLEAQAQNFFFASESLVFPALQPLIQQNESVRIPIQSLEAIRPSATKQKQGISKGI